MLKEMPCKSEAVSRLLLLCLLFFSQGVVIADGSVIDKVYHPYVQPEEREIEFRTIIENNSDADEGDERVYRLGYGQSFTDRWFGEVYLIGAENDDQGFRLEAYELEALWQMTEQGEYSADWACCSSWKRNIQKMCWSCPPRC